MPTIRAASTPSRNVTTRASNMDDFEIEFQFQLEIVRNRANQSQQIENPGDEKYFPRVVTAITAALAHLLLTISRLKTVLQLQVLQSAHELSRLQQAWQRLCQSAPYTVF